MISRKELEELFDEELDTNIRNPDEDSPQVYYSYRGRGESRAGFAIVCSRLFFAHLLMALGRRYGTDDEGWLLEEELYWQDWKQDSFGKSDIIFYWPNVQIAEVSA